MSDRTVVIKGFGLSGLDIGLELPPDAQPLRLLTRRTITFELRDDVAESFVGIIAGPECVREWREYRTALADWEGEGGR